MSINIGAHLSISKGFYAAGKQALKIGANTFQYFSRNPRGGAKKDIDPKDLDAFLKLASDNNFAPLICHAPYTLNPASDKEETRDFALKAFKEDLDALEAFPNALYNFHPGSHVGQGVEVGTKKIIEILNQVLKPEMKTTVLLETMAGKGTEIGRSFEEIKAIIDGVDDNTHLGVCLDTCHVWDAGYDITSFDKVLDEFDRIIGLKRLKAIHLNDSKNPLGSHKDRHELIGKGYIGLDTFESIIKNKRINSIPICLETPQPDEDSYAAEIKMLKDIYNK